MNLFYGLSVMAICLALQSILVVMAIRYYARRQAMLQGASLGVSLLTISSVMMLLVLGNFAQLTIWAGLFYALDEFSSLGEAVYHSAVNFATLGYGDIVMSEKHRILGPIEAINGVLMIGVSTAALTSVFQDIVKVMLKRAKD